MPPFIVVVVYNYRIAYFVEVFLYQLAQQVNLGSNSQSLWTSYYWLKEALHYQSPKVVILDTYSLFHDERYNESSHRLAFDDMRWGTVKKEAIQTICQFSDRKSVV